MKMKKGIVLLIALLFSIPSFSQTYNLKLVVKYMNDARKMGYNCDNVYFPPTKALKLDDELSRIALEHALDMKASETLSHVGSDGRDAEMRLDDAGFNWMAYGENVAVGYSNEQALVKGWLESPSHCENIMARDFLLVGIGIAGKYACAIMATKLP